MNFSEIINRLEKFIRVITAAAIVLSIIEALIVLFIGIASNNIATSNPDINKIWTCILISLVVVYASIIVVKILYNANFPSSITNELKSQKELDELKHEAERQKTISSFVVQTIERLNGQTCALNPGDETHLCDTGIQDGIRELIQPVVANTYFLLNTLNTQFTVGLYLDNYSSLTQPEHGDTDKGVIIIDDTLYATENGIKKGYFKIMIYKAQSWKFKQQLENHSTTMNLLKQIFIIELTTLQSFVLQCHMLVTKTICWEFSLS